MFKRVMERYTIPALFVLFLILWVVEFQENRWLRGELKELAKITRSVTEAGNACWEENEKFSIFLDQAGSGLRTRLNHAILIYPEDCWGRDCEPLLEFKQGEECEKPLLICDRF